LYAGSTVLESAYFANAAQSLEFQNQLNAYIDLQTQVALLFANFKGIDDSKLDMNAIKNDIIEMVQLEADLANVRSVFKFHNLFCSLMACTVHTSHQLRNDKYHCCSYLRPIPLVQFNLKVISLIIF
jgi:hypothetical protein